jgi:hypothetical protein
MAAVQALGYAPETQDEANALAILHHVNGCTRAVNPPGSM